MPQRPAPEKATQFRRQCESAAAETGLPAGRIEEAVRMTMELIVESCANPETAPTEFIPGVGYFFPKRDHLRRLGLLPPKQPRRRDTTISAQ